MGAPCIHGRVASFVGAFYAPHAREGTQILQIKSSKSVETIHGDTMLPTVCMEYTLIAQDDGDDLAVSIEWF
jgi:hypothetical protein